VPASAAPTKPSITRGPITRAQIRTVAGATIGAVLEWFDLLVYAMFAVVLAKQFFPTTDPSVSLLLSLGTFALAWLVRPVGAVVIGAYADRAGRKPALILSAGLMMIGTLLTGALPPYSAIGLAAPLLMMVARLLQGFSAGGEFGSATALLAEQDPARRGFYASLQWSASGLAVFLAAASAFAINSLLTPDQVAAWGWRIPFLLGLLIGPAAWYIRSRGEETPEFLTTTMATNPVAEIAGQDKLRVLLGAGVVAAGAAGSYTINYMPTFAATQLHMGPTTALIGTMVAGLVNTLFPPLFGHLSDRYGRFTVMGLFGALGLLLIYPLFLWVLASPTLATLILVQVIVALVFYCGYYATVPAFLAELFPTRRRTTGISIAYVLAQLVFGGVTPLVVAALIAATGNRAAPGLYLAGVTLLSLGCLWGCWRVKMANPAALTPALSDKREREIHPDPA
jgi:MHS family proline/betaine transporter-like MFS transporter